jgi:hypothetical protein
MAIDMPEHRVRQGECLASIAKIYGFADWQTIYDHPNNENLRRRRPNPNVIYPGDCLFIPDRQQKEAAGETEQRHRFRVRGARVTLRIFLRDMDENPHANKRYSLLVEGQTYEGQTDSEGLIQQAVPADAEEGELRVWLSDEPGSEPMIWPIDIGHLNPVEFVSGVKQRLENLGYMTGSDDEDLDPITRESLLRFQKDHSLPVTGEPDEATRNRLVEKHAGT